MGNLTTEQKRMERAAKVYKQIKEERRFKLAYISGDIMLNMLSRGIGKPLTNEITTIKGVPDNALLMGVDYEIEYGAFVFLIGSLEFDSVPENQRPEGLTLYTQISVDDKK